MTETVKPRRGRPYTGQALSSTERNRTRRERLQAQGHRLLGSVVLTAEASAALNQLTADGRTIDEAICFALLAAVHP